ncbi:MAG: hypothetical protein WCO57_15755 [Verrucomicrobiota bacterium]
MLVSAVVVSAKNWMVLVLPLTGVPPLHVPCVGLNQLSEAAGVAPILEFAQV